ncbi:SPFH domain-containing protein [Acidipropionibacterium virtanenii]|uniref:SPFH domain-containing protein n=1 Tax=Acidipropionibacterium virtanenii TaxID=2057246 RepID=A0A344UR67_9ACTN|nr:SPFH domain-containing protein [Acidipropionibacterium virtanenii]AXE37765.1 hypothetical protein JS278_00572 [Acidipropionibacterium virtanenii]
MGVVQAFAGALGGTFADQWQEIITAGRFDEHTVVGPGVLQQATNGRGSSVRGSADIISDGSRIFIPEGTAAFIFGQSGIEDVIWTPGGYVYQNGMPSVFNGDDVWRSMTSQTTQRLRYRGQAPEQRYVEFINLREIRGIKFGTPAPMLYHDQFYDADLEILSHGTFSLQVVNPVAFVQKFLPPNCRHYTFASPEARRQISAEFIQAFVSAINSLSSVYRISELPSHSEEISRAIADDSAALGAWIERFGLDVVQVAIESIEFSPESREIVKRYSKKSMNLALLEGISRRVSSIASQHRIAQNMRNHRVDSDDDPVPGIDPGRSHRPQIGALEAASTASPSLNEQVDAVKKLKELLDAGILTQDEFDSKKSKILGL